MLHRLTLSVGSVRGALPGNTKGARVRGTWTEKGLEYEINRTLSSRRMSEEEISRN